MPTRTPKMLSEILIMSPDCMALTMKLQSVTWLQCLASYDVQYMSMEPSVPAFFMIAIASGIVAHAALRRYFLACVLAVAATHLIEYAFFAVISDAGIHVTWSPVSIVSTVIFVLPMSLIIGIPFAAARRRIGLAKRKGTSSTSSFESLTLNEYPQPRNRCGNCGENLTVFLLSRATGKDGEAIKCPRCGTSLGN